MPKYFILLAAPALLLALPAQAYFQTTPTTATEGGDSPGTRIVCRRMPPPAGTRLGARNICKTQADWDAIQEDARREVQQQQDRGHFSRGN